jgi:hypothetical protein
MTPVVSVDVGDVPAVLAGLPGCSIHPRDPAKLAAGILQALPSARDPSLRQRAESTSQRAVSERVIAVYTSVLSASRK